MLNQNPYRNKVLKSVICPISRLLCNIDITILKFSQKEKTAHSGTIIYQFDNACYVAKKKLEVKIMNLE